MGALVAHGGAQSAQPDVAVARLASQQHGVVTYRQLVAAGLGRRAITNRVERGQFHRVHRGVYSVGHPIINLHGRWMAAVLSCGDGAVLSHRSAAALWELLRPMEGPVEVSVPSHDGRRRRPGIRLHRCLSLAPSEPIRNAYLPNGGVPDGLVDDAVPNGLVTLRHNIPVTTPARTIHDLKSCVPPRLHRRAIRQVELAGYALDAGVETDGTRSDLERDFLALCRRAGLPPPEVNVRVGRWTVDFLWRHAHLAVEADSYRFHRGATAFEDDHARDLALRAAGLRIHRFTERQLRMEPEHVAADLRAALASS
jgi:hypothetical protein